MSQFYKLPPSAICEKEGLMYLLQEEKKNMKLFFCHVKENIFVYENTQRDGSVSFSLNLLGGAVRIIETRLLDKVGIEIVVVPGVSEKTSMTPAEIKAHPNCVRRCFFVDNVIDANEWMGRLMRCTLPFEFLHESVFNKSIEHCHVVSQYSKVKEMPIPYRRSLLWNKIRILAIHFDFSKEDEENYREIKHNVLLELIDCVNTVPELFSDVYIFQELLQGIKLALYHSNTNTMNTIPFLYMNDDDNENQYDNPEWSHLSLVYDLLTYLVTANQIDNNTRKHYITVPFVNFLITLFNSQDSRERNSLKTATHRIYSKLTNRRATIRKAINNTFYEYLYETHCHFGISELLEILASIINGFTLPIRPEHLQSLMKSLIPLHKSNQYEQYAIQLSFCMCLYIQKDPTLSDCIIKGIFRYWPQVNTSKQLLFLTELEDIFNYLHSQDVKPYCELLVKRFAKCLTSPNNQIIEKVLCICNKKSFATVMIKDQSNFVILATGLYNALQCCCDEKHSLAIQQMAHHIIGLLMDHDMDFITSLSQ